MLTEPTLEKMKTMRLDGMAAAWAEQQQQPSTTQLSFDERLGFLVDAEWTHRENKKMGRALREAKLRLAQACVENIDYPARRELDKAVVRQLASCRWVQEHQALSQAQQARDLARAIADGHIGVVEGSWKIRDLAFAGADVDDQMRALFMPFVAVTSETDHFPIGEERANWDPDVLREKDREIRAYDEACRAQMVSHCRAFAARVDQDVARLTESFMSTPK